MEVPRPSSSMMTRDVSVADARMSLVSESSCAMHTECEAAHDGDQMVQGAGTLARPSCAEVPLQSSSMMTRDLSKAEARVSLVCESSCDSHNYSSSLAAIRPWGHT